MQLDDRIAISTPEGAEIELQLAGLGSRFIAGVLDLVLQLLLVVVLLLVTGAFSGGGHLNGAVAVIGSFCILFFYPILFEVLAAGRTPGKRACHLRVVRGDGSPVDLQSSAVRNLVRVIDGPPLSYLPTVISIAVTRHNQRPGDLAAGTLVIREAGARGSLAAGASIAAGASAVAPAFTEGSVSDGWDVSAITAQELAAVRSFLARRDTLDREARARIAAQLANGLGAKVAGAELRGGAEAFLERLADAKSRRWHDGGRPGG